MTQKVRSAKKKGKRSAPDSSSLVELPAGLDSGYAIARLARLIARDATRRVGEVLGLTLAEWRLLLIMQPEKQVHLDELADRALLEKSHASIAANTLCAMKLARRAASPGDRRRVLFARTVLGSRAVHTYLAATAAERASLWGVLTSAEQAKLRKLLARLLATAESSLGGASGRRAYRPSRPQ